MLQIKYSDKDQASIDSLQSDINEYSDRLLKRVSLMPVSAQKKKDAYLLDPHAIRLSKKMFNLVSVLAPTYTLTIHNPGEHNT